jgi:hypothetical protein
MKTIQLIGYHDNNWCWIITDNILYIFVYHDVACL